MKRNSMSEVHDALCSIVNAKNVLFNNESLAPYASDKTSNLSGKPDIVVKVSSAKEISQIFTLCTSYKMPLIPRGGGTGVTGGAVPIEGGIILSLENMSHILEIDQENMIAVVEPGVTTENLQKAARQAGLMYPPDPASLDSCSIGGNIATSAGGPSALKYGTTKDYVVGLEFVTPDGSIIQNGGKYVKNATGYNLAGLLIGSEGTLAIITKIFLKLIPAPRTTIDLLIPFDTIDQAIDAVFRISQERIVPATIEFMEEDAIRLVATHNAQKTPFPNAGAQLLIKLDGASENEVEAKKEEIIKTLRRDPTHILTARSAEEQRYLWSTRRGIRNAIEKESPIFFAEDTVVPRSKIPSYVKKVKQKLNSFQVRSLIFGHAGDGNVHTDILKDSIPDSEWHSLVPSIKKAIYQITLDLGGTISGEHGIGFLRKQYLHMALSAEELLLMKRLKQLFDPHNILNPGKIFADNDSVERSE